MLLSFVNKERNFILEINVNKKLNLHYENLIILDESGQKPSEGCMKFGWKLDDNYNISNSIKILSTTLYWFCQKYCVPLC